MHVRDVSFDEREGLWFAGSVDSARIPGEETEAALRYQAASGAAFEPRSPRLAPLGAVKVVRKGGLAELRVVDAEGEPVVATSISSPLDDSSSFVFVLGGARTYVRRLKGEMICHIDRPERELVRVFTHQGSVYQGGRAVRKSTSLVPPLLKALGVARRKILVRGLDARKSTIAAAVEVSPQGARDVGQDPAFTALCVSADAGNSFDVLLRVSFKEGEDILDAHLLN